MSKLDEALASLKAHEGVQHVVLAGTDGLLVHHLGDAGGVEGDRVAAMLPGLLHAADDFGGGCGGGEAATVVIELADGVAIGMPLSPDLLLAVVLRPGIPFTGLLREVRRDRASLASLV